MIQKIRKLQAIKKAAGGVAKIRKNVAKAQKKKVRSK